MGGGEYLFIFFINLYHYFFKNSFQWNHGNVIIAGEELQILLSREGFSSCHIHVSVVKQRFIWRTPSGRFWTILTQTPRTDYLMLIEWVQYKSCWLQVHFTCLVFIFPHWLLCRGKQFPGKISYQFFLRCGDRNGIKFGLPLFITDIMENSV
jgi:hypothetical protein